eukprot:355816-Chlamydomonas_euryale.AAC.2
MHARCRAMCMRPCGASGPRWVLHVQAAAPRADPEQGGSQRPAAPAWWREPAHRSPASIFLHRSPQCQTRPRPMSPAGTAGPRLWRPPCSWRPRRDPYQRVHMLAARTAAAALRAHTPRCCGVSIHRYGRWACCAAWGTPSQ